MVKRIVFILTLLLIMPSFSYAEDEPDEHIARISLIDGDISIQRADDKEWVAASVNMPLLTGDYVYSPRNAKAEIQFDNGNYIRLSEETDAGIINLTKDAIQLRITAGKATFGIKGLRGENFEVDTPNAVITPLTDGRYRLDVDNEGNTTLAVQKGKTEITTQGGSISISEGQKIIIEGDVSPEYQISSANAMDGWDEWNDERDKAATSVKSSEYVPPHIGGVEDLDRYGRWVMVSEYGYVWTPTDVKAGWAPYRIGRWIWRDPWGWVWVSYEPWGWVPYHFGRWIFAPPFGWCWVPEGRPVVWRWRPALVRFAIGPTWVSWAPLAPNEAYYWRGAPSVSATVSINANITNAVTTVHRDAFLKGVKVAAPLPPNPFKVGKVIVGPPLIVPVKASLAPFPTKVLPPHAVPPPKLIQRPVLAKTTPPPAPRPFSDKIKEIKAGEGRPVKALTITPQGQKAKTGAKTMPIAPVKEPKGEARPLRPKGEKPSMFERKEEIKKERGPARPGAKNGIGKGEGLPEKKKKKIEKGDKIKRQFPGKGQPFDKDIKDDDKAGEKMRGKPHQ